MNFGIFMKIANLVARAEAMHAKYEPIVVALEQIAPEVEAMFAKTSAGKSANAS